jgi:NADPH:quinone reductase-like Zn-dependent oxidoreductase
MQAVVIHKHGGVSQLSFEQVPLPKVGHNEVLVKLRAAAINHLDLWVREGWPGLRVAMPHILGSDGAGVVAEAGAGVEGHREGDEVLLAPGWSGCGCRNCLAGDDNLCSKYRILGEQLPGTYAEFVRVPAENAFPIPKGLSFEEAAAIPLVFLTAWNMLVHQARVQPGEDVLILAAGSGVGSAGIQIAKLFGARVIATASSEEKLRKARQLGADDVINYQEEDLLDLVMSHTDRRGVDIVFEHVGKSTWNASIKSLRKGGRLVTCGATTGFDAVTDLRYVFFRGIRIIGNFMGRKAGLRDALEFFPDKLRPVIDRTFDLKNASKAHERMARREQFGKIVLTIDEK